MKKKIKQADFLFDLISFLMLLAHIFMHFYGIPNKLLPFPLMVLFFLVTRTGLAGTGHYHCHRAKNGVTDWGAALFDM